MDSDEGDASSTDSERESHGRRQKGAQVHNEYIAGAQDRSFVAAQNPVFEGFEGNASVGEMSVPRSSADEKASLLIPDNDDILLCEDQLDPKAPRNAPSAGDTKAPRSSDSGKANLSLAFTFVFVCDSRQHSVGRCF